MTLGRLREITTLNIEFVLFILRDTFDQNNSTTKSLYFFTTKPWCFLEQEDKIMSLVIHLNYHAQITTNQKVRQRKKSAEIQKANLRHQQVPKKI